MTIGPDIAQAVRAFNRFGFGARPGDLAAAAGDPRGFLLEELSTANVALIGGKAPVSGPSALQAVYVDRAEHIRMAARPSTARSPTAAMPAPTVLAMAPMG